MDPWFAKAAVLVASSVMIAIRAPHGQRSRSVKVVESRKGRLETGLLTLAMVAFVLPLLWIPTPVFSFADYELRPIPFVSGIACFALGLWWFHRAHVDLGTNWSITLEVREQHRLVTNGIYRRIRHPMYLSLLVYSLGQALAVPNWVVGPSYLIAFGVLFGLRLGPEERMMRETFGREYEDYVQRSARLIPGVW
jgi:protein-S-isoprenylcysteine O-methyltransferase Ste14